MLMLIHCNREYHILNESNIEFERGMHLRNWIDVDLFALNRTPFQRESIINNNNYRLSKWTKNNQFHCDITIIVALTMCNTAHSSAIWGQFQQSHPDHQKVPQTSHFQSFNQDQEDWKKTKDSENGRSLRRKSSSLRPIFRYNGSCGIHRIL